MFGGTISPFLSVKTSSGLTNSGTNGWVTSTSRFYSPTNSQWIVNIAIQGQLSISPGKIILQLYNSSNILQSTRTVINSFVTIEFFNEYTCILEMAVGDYFQFVSNNNDVQIFYDVESKTTLQVREL